MSLNPPDVKKLKSLANGHASVNEAPSKQTPSKQGEMAAFDDVFEAIVRDCVESESGNSETRDAMMHFLKVVRYNVPHGKKNRGLSVVASYRHLVAASSGAPPSEGGLFRARVLGWCIELLQAFFLIADDIMDHSKTRRGQACWYLVPGMEDMAINDSFFCESLIYKVLKKYLRSEPCYADVLDLFHETTMQTVIGQGLDLLSAQPPAADEASSGAADFSTFSPQRYDAIVKWKTAFYSFYLPVALAMRLAGYTDDRLYDKAKPILLSMGHYFQVQDDFLDCYGDPAVTGKVGTDIEDNKCGWLINQALLRCTEDQRSILLENYARPASENVTAVKRVFDSLDLRTEFVAYEEKSYVDLMGAIDGVQADLPRQMFVDFMNKIYKRQK